MMWLLGELCVWLYPLYQPEGRQEEDEGWPLGWGGVAAGRAGG